MIPLVTGRLTVRALRPRDRPRLLEILSDARVMEFSLNGPMDAPGVARFIEQCRESYRANGFGLWGLEERATGRLVGFAGLSRVELDGRAEVELGYRLAHDCWGRGLATEAGRAVLDAAFSHWRLASVVAIIARRHTASMNVADKLGLIFDHATTYGGWDVAIYRRTRAATSHYTESEESD